MVGDDAINTDYESVSAPYKSASFPVSIFLNHPSGSCWAAREAVCAARCTVFAVQRVGNEKIQERLNNALAPTSAPSKGI